MAGAASPALGQAVGITAIGSNPNIGNVTAATSGTTEFRISTAGGVTVVPGGGAGTFQGGTTVNNTITLTCSGGGNGNNPCNTTDVRVSITPTMTFTGRAQQLNELQIALGTGAAYAAGGQPSTTNGVVTFTIQPIGRNSNKTFRLGMDLPITGGFGASGLATSAFTVQAGFTPNLTVSATGSARATVRNGTSITKTSDLAFGAILPLSGQTGTVTIDASTGTRTVNSAGVLLRPGATTSRAVYAIQGEGGRVISVSVPSNFQMTGPGSPITVNLTSTADTGVIVTGDAGGTVTVPGGAGASGSINLGVGGSFTVTGPVTAGSYSGLFNVVFNWN